MTDKNLPRTKFNSLLEEQIRHEFTVAQQYTAIAAYLDSEDLPQLAKCFYHQADEEREHAKKIVKYLVGRDFQVDIPGADEVRNRFDSPRDAIALALDLERTTTKAISVLAATARDEDDFLGQQLMWGFLEEQAEEEALMTTLLHVTERAGDHLLDVEAFVAREVNR